MPSTSQEIAKILQLQEQVLEIQNKIVASLNVDGPLIVAIGTSNQANLAILQNILTAITSMAVVQAKMARDVYLVREKYVGAISDDIKDIAVGEVKAQ